MATEGFQFQQFFVAHDRCGMKVGTDCILLGAWADVDSARRILDIGTGCGLLALMAAQRNHAAHIEAVECEFAASHQASENFRKSPWAARLKIWNSTIQEFAPTGERFDSIVCNPPFFSTGLRAREESRRNARHDRKLPLGELLAAAQRLLSAQGKLSMIWPAATVVDVLQAAIAAGLQLSRRTNVSPSPNVSPKRVLLEFGFQSVDLQEEWLTVESSKHVYTDAFRQLTRGFYLPEVAG